jgi:hypothetical protein
VTGVVELFELAVPGSDVGDVAEAFGAVELLIEGVVELPMIPLRHGSATGMNTGVTP